VVSEAIATTRSAPVGLAQERQPAARSLWALDWLNFLMADVQNGLGPYLAVFSRASAIGTRATSASPWR